RPELHGIAINPSIPSAWKGFEMVKMFRGKKLNITVNNPHGAQSGVKKITVNGAEIEGVLIAESILKDVNEVVVEMG
ncbi:MAG: hypothetical protein LBI54_02310, partial [Lachnospiraceae bacterium]|nr:hypothetical protein [Lachnospiraceae bacterium]